MAAYVSPRQWITKTYAVQHPIDLEVGIDEEGNWSLMFLRASNPVEAALIDADDGEYACWDASVIAKNDGFEIAGADGPGGGHHAFIRLTVPLSCVRSIKSWPV